MPWVIPKRTEMVAIRAIITKYGPLTRAAGFGSASPAHCIFSGSIMTTEVGGHPQGSDPGPLGLGGGPEATQSRNLEPFSILKRGESESREVQGGDRLPPAGRRRRPKGHVMAASGSDTPAASRHASTERLEEKKPLQKGAESKNPAGLLSKLVNWKTGICACLICGFAGFWFSMGFLANPCAPQNRLEPCPESWIYYREHCYFYEENLTDWSSARVSCREVKAELTTFMNRQDLDYILKRASKGSHWIGLNKSEKEYKWVNGKPLDQSKFTIQGDGECAYIESKNGLNISLSTCTLPRHSVCKMEPYKGTHLSK